MEKEKIVVLIKKEFFFPDFFIFKKLNKIYWGGLFKRAVKHIKKLSNSNNELVVICDYESKIAFEKEGIKAKTFSEYIKEYKSYYLLSKKVIDRWFDNPEIRGMSCYNGIDTGFILKEEIYWWFVSYLENIEIIKEIIKDENPSKLLTLEKESLFGRCANAVCNSEKLPLNYITNNALTNISRFTNSLIKKYSLLVRFYNFPLINRREFVRTGNIKKIKNKKINTLLMGLDKTYYGRMSGVIEELRKNKEIENIILTTDYDKQMELKKNNINFISFGDFLDENSIKKLKKKKGYLANYWEKIKDNDKFKAIFLYHGISLFETLKQDLKYILTQRFLWIAHYIESLSNLFDSQNVDIVVAIDDSMPPTRTSVLIAKEKNARSLVLQNGAFADPTGYGFIPIIADKIAIWDRATKKTVTNLGENASKTIITGNPLIKKNDIEINGKDLYEKLGLEKEKPLFVVNTLGEGSEFAEKELQVMLICLTEEIKKIQDAQLVISLHPREISPVPYVIAANSGVKNIKVLKDTDILGLVKICDAFITITSTIAIEAISMGKPLIILNLMNRPDCMSYVKSGAALGIYNCKDLGKAIASLKDKRVLENLERGRKKFLKENCSITGQDAIRNILRLIDSMVKKKKNSLNRQFFYEPLLI